ncbi:MAG TPA: TIGR04290 family methyltransferase [Thermoanaerobaculia bacterium]|nr:TIGR04290 family methyltransferase [Thermoanaerobaculia bacterium]
MSRPAPSAAPAVRQAAPRPSGDPAVARQVEELGPWFHNLHLPDGTQTCPDHWLGGDFPRFKWEALAPHIPRDLTGWTALDIGCNAGFYSFELARRGARVTGIDVDPRYLTQARWAAGQLGLEERVEFRRLQVYELGREPGQYDLVLFMGVLYHLRYPLLGLDVVARKCRRLLVFQSLSLPGDEVAETPIDLPIEDREPLTEDGWPKMAFIEHRFAGDPTNWWVPNHAGMLAMLRSAGLQVLDNPAHEIYLCAPDPEPQRRGVQLDPEELAAALGRGPARLP